MQSIAERYRPFRKWRKRLLFWIPFIVAGILIDEYIKEGYLFNPKDIIIPFTHENIIVILLLLLLLLVLKQ